MNPILILSLLALAPLSAHAADACCPDGGKFDAPAGHNHEHQSGGNPHVTLTTAQRANLAIATAPVGPAKIARTAYALGEIAADPRGESAAASRVAGRLVELKVALGDTVAKGDTLAIIESRQPGGDPAKVALTALAAGTVTEVLARLGDPVSPEVPLMRLADLTRLVAEARIPQRHVAGLTPGRTVARLTPEGGEARLVTLAGLRPKADPVAGTLTARFLIDNADGALAPGRRVEFRVVLSEKEFPVTVPRDAVQGERGDLYVFIEESPGVYEKQPIVVVEDDEARVAVTGPDAGEAVVTHGGYSLRYADVSNVSPQEAHDHAGHAHTHADGTVHTIEPAGDEPLPDLDLDPLKGVGEATPVSTAHSHASAPPVASGKTELQAAMDAAHGHSHGPHGEELEDHDAASKSVKRSGFAKAFTGDSGAVFFGTLAAGLALMLGLALAALRRKTKGADFNA